MDHTPANLAVNASPEDGEDTLRCHRCEYDLRGLPAGRCPECGLAFDPDDLPVADIPWLRREALGTWRAYWGTVWLGVMRPRRLARTAVSRSEVDAAGPRVFAKVCIAAALGSFATVLVALLWRTGAGLVDYAMVFSTFPAQAAFLWTAHQAVITIEWRAHGIAYAERLARLKPFTVAPLGTAPVIAVALALFITWLRLGDLSMSRWFVAAQLVSVAPFGLLLLWWSAAIAFHSATSGSNAARTLAYAVAIASVWAALAVAAALAAAICVGIASSLVQL